MTNRLFLILFSFASTFLLLGSVYGQQDPIIRIKHIDYKDGLVGRRTTATLQDSDGFMWIATVDALNRYDGVNFKHFNQSNSELNYRELGVRDFYEDDEGFLWLIYKDGIEFIHHETFEVLSFEERFGNTDFQYDKIRFSSQNENGQILIELNNFKKYLYHNKTLKYLPFIRSVNFYLTLDGIWDVTRDSLTLYDFEGNNVQTLNIPKQHLKVFHQNKNGEIFYTSYDKDLEKFRFYSYYQGEEKDLAAIPIENYYHGRWRFQLDTQNNFIIVYNSLDIDKEIYYIDLDTRKYKRIPIDGDKHFLCKDRNEVIWFGHNEGLTLVELSKTPFEYYEDVINARGIWANTEKVVVASSHLDNFLYDNGDKKNKVKIDRDIYAISKDQSSFWGGSNGLFLHLDLNTNQVLHSIPFNKKFTGNIWSCLKDSNGNWWFGYELNGNDQHLLFYNPTQSDTADAFTQYNSFEDLKGAHVIHFLEDENFIWASSNKGLIQIDNQKGVIGHYWSGAKEGFQLPFTDIYWLYKDSDNFYWAGTNHKGLVKFSLDASMKVQSVKSYSTNYDLSSDVVYSVFEDSFGRLWLSTLNGISVLDKDTEETRIFTDQYSELPINEFNRTSGFQAIDGKIYFGGVKGAISFHPKDIDTTSFTKPLMLSAVNIFIGDKEEEVDKTGTLQTEGKLVLHPSVRYSKIEIALADYFDANAIQYYYKIEGLHDDFRSMDGNSVQLNNLPYGTFDIRFKAQAKDKRFSTNEITLPLKVVRPFYLRWWFILVSVLFGIGILWQLFNWRVAQLKRRQLELEKVVTLRTEELQQDKVLIEQQAEELKAIDQLKDRFFANISHELRTPLTLILGPLGNLLNNSDQLTNKQFTYLNVIKRHSNYLMKRINEIMELNRLEVDKGQVDLQPTKLYDFFKVSIGNFESIAPEKQIIFRLIIK